MNIEIFFTFLNKSIKLMSDYRCIKYLSTKIKKCNKPEKKEK